MRIQFLLTSRQHLMLKVKMRNLKERRSRSSIIILKMLGWIKVKTSHLKYRHLIMRRGLQRMSRTRKCPKLLVMSILQIRHSWPKLIRIRGIKPFRKQRLK
jgi:predicted RNA binding protein YcfA (HicA-like mRNA interferase family)